MPDTGGRLRHLAEMTPPTRNRFVDLMRAVAILFVVVGHWLAAVPLLTDGSLTLTHVLNLSAWAHWLTWIFQVMPIFFIVGGYANAASWQSAQRRDTGFVPWVMTRLARLVKPVLPLLLVWFAVGLLVLPAQIDPHLFQQVSRIALNPVWFLAVYLVVVMLTPVSFALWREFGVRSFVGLAVAALAIDILAFSAGHPLLRWLNYGLVWMAVAQLGHIWHGGLGTRPRTALALALAALGLLLLFVLAGPYPVSMISVAGADISNSRPPTMALLALAVTQFGLLLALEGRFRRWLQRPAFWMLTVLLNLRIMTIFLWHLSALAVVVLLSYLLGGIGMLEPPMTAQWWSSRPLWLLAAVFSLLLLVGLFGKFESPLKGKAVAGPAPAPWRVVTGALLVSAGFALIALLGIGGAGPVLVQLLALLTILLGARLLGMLPSPRRSGMAGLRG